MFLSESVVGSEIYWDVVFGGNTDIHLSVTCNATLTRLPGQLLHLDCSDLKDPHNGWTGQRQTCSLSDFQGANDHGWIWSSFWKIKLCLVWVSSEHKQDTIWYQSANLFYFYIDQCLTFFNNTVASLFQLCSCLCTARSRYTEQSITVQTNKNVMFTFATRQEATDVIYWKFGADELNWAMLYWSIKSVCTIDIYQNQRTWVPNSCW